MRFWISLLLVFLALIAGAWIVFFRHPISNSQANVQGIVMDDSGPVQGAKVRYQGNPDFVLSNAEARFELPANSDRQRIKASKEGFFIEGISPQDSPLTLKLKRLPAKDNENYVWVDPTPDAARQQNCGNCHREIYDEWSASGHARSAA